MMASRNRIGYLLSGTEGEARNPANIGYFHRADRLRASAESKGLNSAVCYTRSSKSDVSAIRRLLRAKSVLHRLPDCDVVYGAGSDAAALAAWAFRKTNVPVVYDVHTPAVGEKWLQFRLSPSPRMFAIYIESCLTELIAIRKSDAMLWSSSIQRDYYRGRGFPAERLFEIRHGVDLEVFRPHAMHEGAVPLLCYAGTMVGYQGAGMLVEAFERIPSDTLRFRMIGFTERDTELRMRAEKAGIETVPQIPHSELLEKLAECDCTCIVAHPDAVKYKNGAAPTKWPESLALGRPVLSGDAYDTAQLIRDLRVGRVVENTVEGYRSGMEALASSTTEERKEMGARARAEAERNYGWETIGTRFVDVLRSVTKR